MPYQRKALAPAKIEPRPILKEITVVIPTLGRPILEECLYWIMAGSAWPGRLIVIDQGSSSRVASWIEELQLFGNRAEYVPSNKRGRAAGVNSGLKRANTRFVSVTDDDCFVEETWLVKMVETLNEHPDAIVTGRVEAASDDVILVVTSQTPRVQRRPRLAFDGMSGGNMGTSRAVIDRVGLFDEDPRLRTAEDGEWAYRALRAGVPIVYAPDVCVRHYGWREKGERVDQYRDYARSHGGFYGKYLRKGDWFIALRAGVHHVRAFRRWLSGTVGGDPELQQYGRAYLTGLLPGIIAGIRRG